MRECAKDCPPIQVPAVPGKERTELGVIWYQRTTTQTPARAKGAAPSIHENGVTGLLLSPQIIGKVIN